MAAPDSPPGLSVVSDGAASAKSNPKRNEPIARTTAPKQAGRSGAPWWLVAVVAVVGMILFITQLQRANRLDSRVTSLTDELASTGQQLEIANLHLVAHQSHLQRVRENVAALSDQVSGLQALADRDPLAPSEIPEVSASQTSESNSDAIQSDADGFDEQTDPAPALTDADGYYWRADSAAPAPVSDADQRAILDGEQATTLSDD